MKFSVAALFLVWYICSNMAHPIIEEIEDSNFGAQQGGYIENFKIRIKEKQAKIEEKIYIRKNNDIEYFKVPPHNGLSETDNLYDFKMITGSARLIP
ncbi:hypothetical protein AC249_AIPGENE15240 [Exaiptasia diaphana]|nr:hypothetical protein AC249_AIPGENE15240 [Exaiptasia diaphana]